MRTVTRIRYASAIFAFALLFSSLGRADAANFTGTWSFNGTIVFRNGYSNASPICILRQAGSNISGTCKGPNGIGAAAGIVNGNAILLRWNHIPTTSLGLRGIATFHGAWGADGVIRGTWMDTALGSAVGNFTAQKVK
jgi:hypothetical protein